MRAKPYQVWAQERAAAESAADRKLREAALGSQAIGQGLDSLKPQPAPTVHKPTHDWDRSAMFAAERAAGLEKMDKGAQIDRDNEEWKVKLHLKYAPKKGGGGAGPVSKTVAKLLELHKVDPADATQAARVQQQIGFYENQLRRYGKAGEAALADLSSANVTSAKYGASGKFAREKEIATGKQTQAERAEQDRAEREALKVEAGIQAGAAKPPQGGFESQEARTERLKLLDKAQTTARKIGKKKKRVTMPNGEVMTVEDDEDGEE